MDVTAASNLLFPKMEDLFTRSRTCVRPPPTLLPSCSAIAEQLLSAPKDYASPSKIFLAHREQPIKLMACPDTSRPSRHSLVKFGQDTFDCRPSRMNGVMTAVTTIRAILPLCAIASRRVLRGVKPLNATWRRQGPRPLLSLLLQLLPINRVSFVSSLSPYCRVLTSCPVGHGPWDP